MLKLCDWLSSVKITTGIYCSIVGRKASTDNSWEQAECFWSIFLVKTPKCHIWDTSGYVLYLDLLSLCLCHSLYLYYCVWKWHMGFLKGLRRWWICQSGAVWKVSCNCSACPAIGNTAVCNHDVSNASVFNIYASMRCWVWVKKTLWDKTGLGSKETGREEVFLIYLMTQLSSSLAVWKR